MADGELEGAARAARDDAAAAVRARPADHPPLPEQKVGVLLVNLGTPDRPETGAVRRYLREFLSDPRVIEYPPLLWGAILHGVILNVRPPKTARAYALIWDRAHDDSPLRVFTRAQAENLAERAPAGAVVDFAMRYGAPAIRERLEAMQQAGCDRVLVVPLYPQYSATTTASVCDAVFDALKEMRWMPAVRVAPPFHDDPAYIDALAATTRRALDGRSPEKILLSFHGLPERYFLAGDPYHCHCAKTARLLRAAMGWSEEQALLTFQSKFGPEKWLEPATQETAVRLAEEGVKRVAVIAPGFVADCIETLEELALGVREAFEAAGGEEFVVIPCLNDAPEMTDLLSAIVRREAAGWLAPA